MSRLVDPAVREGERLAIYGCGGMGRDIPPLLRARADLEVRSSAPADWVFVDDDPLWQGQIVNGLPVMSFEEMCREPDRGRKVIVALAEPLVRQKVVAKLRSEGFSCRGARAPETLIYDDVTIGEGCILFAHSMVTSNTTIGEHFHANWYCYVAHDCVIGDYVTFAPRVSCNGRVIIEDLAYIGTGAILKQGQPGRPLKIGRGATVGMGAVVTRDVPPGVTVVGNPARERVQ